MWQKMTHKRFFTESDYFWPEEGSAQHQSQVSKAVSSRVALDFLDPVKRNLFWPVHHIFVFLIHQESFKLVSNLKLRSFLSWTETTICYEFWKYKEDRFILLNTAHMIQIQKSWNHKPWQFEVEWNHKKLMIFTGNFQIRPNHRSFIGNEHTENSQLEFNHTLI